MMKKTLALLALAGSTVSCAVDAEPAVDEGDVASQTDGFAMSQYALYSMVNNIQGSGTLNICLRGTGVTTANRSDREGQIRRSIMQWVEAIRPVSTVTLITSAQIAFNRCDIAALHVNWDAATGRASASAKTRVINLFSNDGEIVVLHEMGHIFGLGDLYIEGVWSCKPGQPNSAMCTNRSTLTSDDVTGAQEVFCGLYADRCKRRWTGMLSWCSHYGAQLFTGKFNSDDRTDLLCHDMITGRKWVALADADGRFTGTSFEAPLAWCTRREEQLLIGDFNGDRRDDMLCHNTTTGEKWIAFATPSGTFTGTNWNSRMGWCTGSAQQLLIGDFNGDGRADMLCHSTATGEKWVTLADTLGRFTGTTWYSAMSWCNGLGERVVIGDVNGDLRDDMLCHSTVTGQKWVALADLEGRFTRTNWQAAMNWCSLPDEKLYLGRINLGLAADMICHNASSGVSHVALAQPGGSYLGTSRHNGIGWCSHANTQFLVGDFDGNGSADFLCHDQMNGQKWIAYNVP